MSNDKKSNLPKRLKGPLSFLKDGHHRHASGIFNSNYDYETEILINKKVNIVFQPIVDLSSNNFHAFEALSRSPIDSPLPYKTPFAVINEKNHKKLDLICLEHIFNCLEHFNHFDELNHQRTHFFVNCLLSNCSELKKMQIPKSIREKTTIEFDLNHTFFDFNQFIKIVENLKKNSFKIALDDVGETHIDLNLLTLLAPDFIKIDISVVLGICNDSQKQEKAKLIIDRANSLGSQIIAEGVETKEDLDVLTGMGVKLIQGFLFSKPLQFIPEEREEIDKIIRKAA